MELIKKFISIIVLVFLCFSNSFANQDEIKKMIKKNENYNLGLSKKDTTVQGVKLKPPTKIDAFNYSVKKNYGWTKYGVKVVKIMLKQNEYLLRIHTRNLRNNFFLL